MFVDPRALFLLIVLVGVTGYVVKGLLVAWYRLSRGDKATGASLNEMEERLRKVEAATSSLLVDVSGMREKQRFMAKLQAGAVTQEKAPRQEQRVEGDLSPMVTQSTPVILRPRG